MSQETLSERRAKGLQAAQIYAWTEPLFTERERQLVMNAVRTFRAGGLDGTAAIAYIAGLSELCALREELEHRVRQGERAAVALVKDQT